MISSSAYLLVFHGSRSRSTQSAASDLCRLLTIKFRSRNNILTQPNYLKTNLTCSELEITTIKNLPMTPLVEVAALELASLSLNESLVNFAQTAYQKGYRKIKVIPLFLAPGIHVTKDIPDEIALAAKRINNHLTIELLPYLGKYSGMIPLISREFSQLSGETRILVAHGSPLSTATKYFQNLSVKLKATIAYWSISPSLREQVATQIAAGYQKIAILPYFLFPGKISRAIALEVEALQAENPQVELILGQPLGACEALAQLIFEEVEG